MPFMEIGKEIFSVLKFLKNKIKLIWKPFLSTIFYIKTEKNKFMIIIFFFQIKIDTNLLGLLKDFPRLHGLKYKLNS